METNSDAHLDLLLAVRLYVTGPVWGPEGSASRDCRFHAVPRRPPIMTWNVSGLVVSLYFTSGISTSEIDHCQQRQSKNAKLPARSGGFARSLLDAGSQFTIRNGHSAPRPAAAGDPEKLLTAHAMPTNVGRQVGT